MKYVVTYDDGSVTVSTSRKRRAEAIQFKKQEGILPVQSFCPVEENEGVLHVGKNFGN